MTDVPDERRELDAMARAMSVTVAGSSSGGESTHLSRGFIFRTAGVPGLGGIPMGCASLS